MTELELTLLLLAAALYLRCGHLHLTISVLTPVVTEDDRDFVGRVRAGHGRTRLAAVLFLLFWPFILAVCWACSHFKAGRGG